MICLNHVKNSVSLRVDLWCLSWLYLLHEHSTFTNFFVAEKNNLEVFTK